MEKNRLMGLGIVGVFLMAGLLLGPIITQNITTTLESNPNYWECFGTTIATGNFVGMIPFLYYAMLVLIVVGMGFVVVKGIRDSVALVLIALASAALLAFLSAANPGAVAEASVSVCLQRDGSLPMTGNLDMDGNDIANAGTIQSGGANLVRSATLVVCASDALNTTQCDYTTNGTNDDEEINAAIAVLPDYGSRLRLTGLIFRLGDPIAVNKTLILEGDGVGGAAGTTITLAANANSDAVELTAGRAILRDFRIDGNASNQTGTIYCIDISAGIEAILENLELDNCKSDGLHVTSPGSAVRGIDVKASANGGHGVFFGSLANADMFVNLTVNGNAGAGLYVDGMPESYFVNVTADQNGSYGIRLKGDRLGLTNFWAGGNTATGLYLYQANFSNISNGNLYGNSVGLGAGADLIVSGSSNNNFSGITSQNLLGGSSNNWIGIELSGAHNNTFSGLNISKAYVNSSEAIDIRDASTYNHFANFDFNSGGNTDNKTVRLVDAGSGNSFISGRVQGTTLVSVEGSTVLANQVFRDVAGFVTAAKGTATITATSIAVTHGLSITPAAGQCLAQAASNPTDAVGTIWIDTYTSTQFTVNVESDPGTSNLDIVWQCSLY